MWITLACDGAGLNKGEEKEEEDGQHHCYSSKITPYMLVLLFYPGTRPTLGTFKLGRYSLDVGTKNGDSCG